VFSHWGTVLFVYSSYKIKCMYKKEDFKCVDGFFYVGDIMDYDGNPWVDEEQLDQLLKSIDEWYQE